MNEIERAVRLYKEMVKSDKYDTIAQTVLQALERQKPVKPIFHTDSVTCGHCWTEIKTIWQCCPSCTKLIDWSGRK